MTECDDDDDGDDFHYDLLWVRITPDNNSIFGNGRKCEEIPISHTTDLVWDMRSDLIWDEI